MTTTIELFQNDETRNVYAKMAAMFHSYRLLGMEIKSALDVGICRGQWAYALKQAFPEVEVVGVDPDPAVIEHLKLLASHINLTKLHTVALGVANTTAKFEKPQGDSLDTAGSGSLYSEVTGPALDQKRQVFDVCVRRMDTEFYDKTFDIIKLDTQGSEYDIILGGQKTIKKTTYLQIELSFVEYNAHAPLFSDYIKLLDNMNFVPIELMQAHAWVTTAENYGYVGTFSPQVDLLFINKEKLDVSYFAKRYLGVTGHSERPRP
jgi:FkbM family methyltransferase